MVGMENSAPSLMPDGQRSVQRVLQYPVCLIVVSDTYALLGDLTLLRREPPKPGEELLEVF